jgi:LmbE family N-acetylglucosaminyl deacetylase
MVSTAAAGRRALDALCGSTSGQTLPAVALVVAHPDDETIAATTALLRLPRCVMVAVTDGAPGSDGASRALGFATREAHACTRRDERIRALARAGVGPSRVHELDVADQQVACSLAPVARQLARLFRSLDVRIVITHPYEGGHPDHDATAFAVHAAARLVARDDRRRAAPVVLELTSYHERAGEMACFSFLPDARHRARTVRLGSAERELKQRMYDCYESQRAVLDYFPIAVERFRAAPRYDFGAPPADHLWYAHFDWGMTGPRWRSLARAAAHELDLAAELLPC